MGIVLHNLHYLHQRGGGLAVDQVFIYTFNIIYTGGRGQVAVGIAFIYTIYTICTIYTRVEREWC